MENSPPRSASVGPFELFLRFPPPICTLIMTVGSRSLKTSRRKNARPFSIHSRYKYIYQDSGRPKSPWNFSCKRTTLSKPIARPTAGVDFPPNCSTSPSYSPGKLRLWDPNFQSPTQKQYLYNSRVFTSAHSN